MNKNKVLIVDDDLTNLKIIEAILHNETINKTLNTGINIIKETIEFKPDVIILDIMMPDKDGYECLKELTLHDLTSDIPIIMLSAKIEHEDVKKSLNNGAFEYVKKPVDSAELLSKLRAAIKIHEKNKEIKEYKSYANVHESLLHARRIQNSFLPDKEQRRKLFPTLEILFLPKEIVSGDFYWMNEIDDKKMLFLGDCTGHGVPASMISIMGFTLLNKNINYKKETDPSKILSFLTKEINNILNSKDSFTMYDGMDAGLIVFEKNNNNLFFAGARMDLFIVSKRKNILHNGKNLHPIQSDNNIQLFKISSDVFSIGKESIGNIFNKHHIKIEKGDRIFLWTDGVYEQLGSNENYKIKKYSKRKFFDFFIKIQNLSINKQKTLIAKEIEEWKGDIDQLDDITFMGLEIM